MPNNEMDYSLIHRTPDGNGKILVTTPGSPDKGSWETEAELKAYVNQDVVMQTDIVDNLTTHDSDKVLSAEQGTVLKQLIDAVSGGITPKGDILSSNLPAADDSNKGWQYYCTDLNKYATSDGTQWVYTSNSPIVQIPDATDTGHALSNAVVTQKCNAVEATLDQHDARLQNLEQKAGDYSIVQYRGTNAVPTGKAKYGLVEKIVGKSRAWNQLVQNGNFATNDNWYASSYASILIDTTNHKCTVVASSNYHGIKQNASFISSHIYMYSVTVSSSDVSTLRMYLDSAGFGSIENITSMTKTFYMIRECTANASSFTLAAFSNAGTFVVSCIQFYDLTLIFGSGNEPATVADALTALPALGQYDAYDAGSIVDTEISGVKSVGVNLWDEEWENGRFIWDTGEDYADDNAIRSKNFNKILPNTDYYYIGAGYVFLYDIDKNFIQYESSRVFTTPSNAYYFRLISIGESTYNHNIQICLNSLPDAVKTTYHPNMTDTLSLPETVTLRSAGSVADELHVESGVVTRKVGVVDLGSLNWTTTYQNRFYATISDVYSSSDNTANLLCEKYIAKADDTHGNMWLYNGSVYIHDENYVDASAFKSAMNGVTLNYELATPLPVEQVCDPIPDNFIQVEGGGTVETIQTQTPVIDNCLDVGYLAV